MADWLRRPHEFTMIDDDSAIVGGGGGDWTTSLTGGDAFSFRGAPTIPRRENAFGPQRIQLGSAVRLRDCAVLEIETDGAVATFSALELREILEWARANRPARATPIDPAERPGGDGEI